MAAIVRTLPVVGLPLVVACCIAYGCLAMACDASSEPAPVLEATTSRAVAEGDDPTVVAPDAISTPALGARHPLVIVTLFTDYQCVNCRRMHDIAARLLDRWPDEVQVQFRQLPLHVHPLARPAAVAALAAHRQGRFACMNSALIRSRTSWTRLATDAFFDFTREQLASRCGLASERFMQDLDDPRLAAKVEADWRLAGDLALRGSPTVLVDGLTAELWPVAGVQPAMLLNSLVRRSLREARSQLGHAGTAAQVDATAAPSCSSSQEPCALADLPARRIFGNTGDLDHTMRLLDAD